MTPIDTANVTDSTTVELVTPSVSVQTEQLLGYARSPDFRADKLSVQMRRTFRWASAKD